MIRVHPCSSVAIILCFSQKGVPLMLKTVALPLAVLALALCAWAAIPVGRVSSSQPFEMNGAIVPVEGVPSWPLSVGDVIVTHSAPATVIFRGGSQVILE